jgi:drug/metabolite transporter (DMT)-like permease
MAVALPIADLVNRLPAAAQAGIWMTSAGATFTGMMAIAKHVSPDLHVFEISLLRAVFGLMFMVPFVVRHRMNALRTRNTPGLMLRGALAFGTNVCLFSAAALIAFADIAAIAFTRPIFASLAAIVVLHETARGRRWTAIAAGFTGAMIVVRPGFADINAGVAFAFGAVALQVVNSVLLKYLTYSDSPDTIALYQPIYSIPFALVPALFVWVTPTWEHVAWFVLMGFLGMLTQRASAEA